MARRASIKTIINNMTIGELKRFFRPLGLRVKLDVQASQKRGQRAVAVARRRGRRA